MSTEQEERIAYCKAHNIHHLMELLATKTLVDRPSNPFEYLRDLLTSVEASEKAAVKYDPTEIKFDSGRQEEEKEGTTAGAAETAAEGGEKKRMPKKITLATLGLNNAGKTTIISALGGEILTTSSPTVGFTPVHFHTEEHDICLFDLGGAANFRGVWVHYFHDCHGLIYVVDSASDDATLAESLVVLKNTLEHPYMRGKPVLILSNKRDLEESRGADLLPSGYLEEILPPDTPHRLAVTCGLEEDDDRDAQVEWLLNEVTGRYEELTARVQRDVAEVKEAKRKAREERLAALQSEEA